MNLLYGINETTILLATNSGSLHTLGLDDIMKEAVGDDRSDFCIDRKVQKIKLVMKAFRSALFGFGAVAVIRAIRGTPILPFPIWLYVVVIVCGLLTYFIGQSWGDKVSFTDGKIVIYRNQKLKVSVDLDRIVNAKVKDSVISFEFTQDAGTNGMGVIPREGFDDESWSSLQSIFTQFAVPR